MTTTGKDSKLASEQGWHKYLSCRWTVAFMFCLLRMCQTSLRQNIGMALVCMAERPSEGGGSSNLTHYGVENYTIGQGNVTVVYNGEEDSIDSGASVGCSAGNHSARSSHCPADRREFVWSATFEGVVLSSYYYGYLIAPLISSYLDRVVGPKRLVGGAVGVGALVNFLSPSFTRLNSYLLVALRFVAGFTNGMVDPPAQTLWAAWAPKPEVAHLTAVEYTGVSLGGIFTFLLSGLLCQIPLDNGWPFVFYFYGSTSAVWLVLWVLLIYNTPQEHPRISQHELEYITQHTHVSKGQKEKIHPPWCRILRSGPVWAIVAATATFTWVYSWILAYLPMYMQDVLQYTMTENAVLSSLPFVGKFITGLLCGYLADRLLRTRLSVAAIRKLFQVIGSVGVALCTVFIGFQDFDTRGVAAALLILGISFQNITTVSFRINALDIAPRYAAFILGLSSTVAVACSMTAPTITSALVTEKTREEWQIMFYMVAALSILGALVFVLWGSGTLQDWARLEDTELEEENHESSSKQEGYHDDNEGSNSEAGLHNHSRESDGFLDKPKSHKGPRTLDSHQNNLGSMTPQSRRRHEQKSATLAVMELDAASQWSSNRSITGS